DLTYGIALGAGLMFLFDPRRGAGRRAIIRQKAASAAHEVEIAAGIGARDLEHRAEGALARLASFFGLTEPRVVSADVLVARVRAELGRVCSHPRAVDVVAKGDGCIELKGPILGEEVDRVLDAVAHVQGVKLIDAELEVYDAAGDHPALQGPTFRPKRRLFASPASRLFLGIGGAGVCLASLIKGSALGLLAGGAVVVGAARSIAHRGGPRALPPSRTAEARGLREAYPAGSEWAPAAAQS
ncbi:MAG: hypothetical protein K0S65_4551, partial [Labilithrix sp.]|nr:hypothetical protein [Labilithrix sp.]